MLSCCCESALHNRTSSLAGTILEKLPTSQNLWSPCSWWADSSNLVEISRRFTIATVRNRANFKLHIAANMHLLPGTRGRWINYNQRTLSILWVFNDRLPPQRMCLAYEWRLLQLQEDGPQAADVLGVFGVLGVELAQSGDFLPRLAWHLLVTVLDECFLRRPESTSRKLGNRSQIICNSNSSKHIKWTLYLSSYSQALGFCRQPSKCILSTSALEFFWMDSSEFSISVSNIV